MTTIKEALQPYYSNNPFIKITKALKLEKDLKNIAADDPRFEFFLYLIEHKNGGRFIFPDDVLNLCNDLGLVTLEDLDGWLNAVRGQVILSVIDPKLNFDLTVSKSVQELKDMITANAVLEKDCSWDFGDSHYYLLSMDELRQVLAKCPINRRKYVTEEFDCEDFARTTKAWLQLHQVKNIAFASIEVNFYKDGKIKFAHGINLVPLREGKVVCVEPQNDQIWEANKPEFGFGCDEMRIRFIQF